MNNKDELFKSALNEFKKTGYFKNQNIVVPEDDKAIYKLAVELAYKDLQWRTVKKHNNSRKESNIDRIAKNFKNNVENQGNHIELINGVKVIFDEDFGETARDQCFGKAQKVVNMTLKYVYCLNKDLITDYDNRDMPLDDRIIDFYYSYEKHPNEEKVSYWSKITENQYINIQRNLKEYAREIGLDMSPIEAEFIIWNYATAKLVETACNKVQKKYNKLKKSKTYDCFEYVKTQLNKLK